VPFYCPSRPSTNQAQRRATTLIEKNVLLLIQSANSGSNTGQWTWFYHHVILTSKFCRCREATDKLRRAIASGRENETTKRNKILSRADKDLKKFNYELSTATAEVSCAFYAYVLYVHDMILCIYVTIYTRAVIH